MNDLLEPPHGSATPASDEIVELVFERMGMHGDAVAKHAGKDVFVSNAIPGERALVHLRKHYRHVIGGELVELRIPSPHRVEPKCALFGRCGGCQLQHIDYAHQLELKTEIVRRTLHEAGLGDVRVQATLGMDVPWHYRNHGRFTIEKQTGRVGFMQRRPKAFLPVVECPILDPQINDFLAAVQGRLVGATQCNVRVGVGTRERTIQPRLPQLEPEWQSGQTQHHERLAGHVFRVSAASFFQVNTLQAERMVALVREATVRTGDEFVIDAYAGVGTFAVALASVARRVLAIEESKAAIADATLNIAGCNNLELRLGKSEDVFTTLDEPVDAVILDPPRSGCERRALDAVLRLGPRTVVYVSCEPETLARDLLHLVASGAYQIAQVQPIDMFPHTRHVECVAVLERMTGASA